MKAFKAKWGEPRPIEVEVPRIEPWESGLRDSQGDEVFRNTHFATRSEAWTKLLREVAAGEELCLSSMKDERRRLRRARTNLIRASEVGIQTRAAHDAEKEAEAPHG